MAQGEHGRPSLTEDLSEARPDRPRGKGLRSHPWRLVMALAAAGATLGLLGFMIARGVRAQANDPGVASRTRAVIDAETGELFPEFRVREGTSIPWRNPKSGRETLYPATECFWTADGKAKIEPTYVLLNEYLGRQGPTLCPDCGRRVVAHNPLPPVELLVEAAGGGHSGATRKGRR